MGVDTKMAEDGLRGRPWGERCPLFPGSLEVVQVNEEHNEGDE